MAEHRIRREGPLLHCECMQTFWYETEAWRHLESVIREQDTNRKQIDAGNALLSEAEKQRTKDDNRIGELVRDNRAQDKRIEEQRTAIALQANRIAELEFNETTQEAFIDGMRADKTQTVVAQWHGSVPLTLDDLREELAGWLKTGHFAQVNVSTGCNHTAELERMRPVYDSAMAYHRARYSTGKRDANARLDAWFDHNSACHAAAKQEQADGTT